ncbi:hypothetical protein MPSEU_000732000 [Mayamaea pseudoterrestris]|nr:hypothetical protein MPSEU_000732000 [Mayamaea pseudoterrestris]
MHANDSIYDTHELSLKDDDADMMADFHETISSLDNRSRRPWYARREVFYFGGFLGLVLLITAIAVPSSKAAQAKRDGNDGPVVFVPELPANVVQTNKQEFGNTLLSYYNTYGLNGDSKMLEVGTPQQLALEWVAGSRNYALLERAQKVQRYALGVFYYSTFSQSNSQIIKNNGEGDIPGWTSSINWISSITECDWEGVTCSEDGSSVVGILLREHSLTGTLPLEMAFLQSLTTLDLTTNSVYVDGDANVTPFTHLGNLETLLMEDNYVVCTSGIPPSISALTSLSKLTMSYNILQGPMDGSIFSNLSKLTHLEIESNFLSGDVPSSIAQLPNLIYLYLRRNLLTIDLPTLLSSGSLPSIFALWLDSNTIEGSIPTSIGSNHPDLASLSITNATLSGPIPTEIGLLSGLRRVWLYENSLSGQVPSELSNLPDLEVLELYENNLSGSMPSTVCDRIQSAAYDFKALTADCQEVSCSCCTECY